MATRLAQTLAGKMSNVVEYLLDAYTRLKIKTNDFDITYQFLDGEQCLRLEVRPTNDWSKLAFKTIHDMEIEDDAKEHAKTPN